MQTENVQFGGTILTLSNAAIGVSITSVKYQEPGNEEIAQLAVSNGWMEQKWLVYSYKNIICYIRYLYSKIGVMLDHRGLSILGCCISIMIIYSAGSKEQNITTPFELPLFPKRFNATKSDIAILLKSLPLRLRPPYCLHYYFITPNHQT